ncbi:MAG: C10 family peptidase [Prevotella sp.]|nr:C10 family peptidase [Prevotella sp.]
MRKIILLLLALLTLPAWAQKVDEQTARQRAEAFLRERGKQLPANGRMKVMKGRHATANDAGYYVFNIGSHEGFVIVSGDDRAQTILGYADKGCIDVTTMPDGLRFMLDAYAEEVESLSKASTSGTPHAAAPSTRSAIAPLVDTHWNQGVPYNSYCPKKDDVPCVTGCVATSMAQVMYYHQWPTTATQAIPGYTSRNKLHTLDGLPATTLNWNDMTTTYSSDASGTPAETAVATLMQYCGWSVQMNYNVSGTGGSSAYNVSIAEALKTYFDYDGSVSYAQRQHYTYQQWVDMVYTELANRRPVVLGGQSMGGGHSFVCDGYDTDDFFHINWGWGGSSDGYFRLSALNPEEQGFGGSSSLDGFSFTQDAVVGIRPYQGTDGTACLSLEKLQLDATGSQTETTVTRTDASSPFTGIPLYVSLCSYVFGTNAFDEALMLIPANGTLADGHILYSSTNTSYTFNTANNLQLTPDSPSALADGHYTIKAVSRLHGKEEWKECYDGPQQQLTATVSGNTMTLRTSVVDGTATLPTAVAFTVSGNRTKGYEQTVTASVTGSSADYYGNLVLRVNGTGVMGKSVEIPAGQTVDVRFTYIPTTAGNNTLSLYNAKSGGRQIGADDVIAIAESDATNNLDLTFNVTIDNKTSSGQLYAHAFRATVTAHNASAEYSYVGQLNCSTRLWTDNGDGNWTWTSLGVTHYPLTVGKGADATVHVAADDLPSEGLYSFRLTYQRVTEGSTVADACHVGLDEQGIGSLRVADGYALGDANGNRTIHEPSSVINGGDACFVDLRALSTLNGITVNAGSNPNCLYLLPDGAATPAGLTSQNVVCGTTADQLTLTDGHDFYSPIDFTASEAAYTRTFTLAAAGTSGWNTLVVPFSVETVSVGNGTPVEKTWFRSDDDTEGDFWLRTFTSDGEGRVVFGHAQRLDAYTPYIIAVPGDTWGDEWKMTDRPVTFSATDATIAATKTASVSGNHYKFCGTTVSTTVGDCYALNARGSKFVKATSADIEAFRAWFVPNTISSLTLPSLTIASPDATVVSTIVNEPQTNNDWFTLDGRCLNGQPNKSGIYINNGKKVKR